MLVRKPRTSGRSGIKTTLYQGIPGELQLSYAHTLAKVYNLGWHSFLVYASFLCFRDPSWHDSAVCWTKFEEHETTACHCQGVAWIGRNYSQFGPVLSYQCPLTVTRDSNAFRCSCFPPTPSKINSHLNFVPTCTQFYHMESLKEPPSLSSTIENGTVEQSAHPLWKKLGNHVWLLPGLVRHATCVGCHLAVP